MCLLDCCQNEGGNEEQLESPDELILLSVSAAVRLVHHTAAPEVLRLQPWQQGPARRQQSVSDVKTATQLFTSET